MGKVFSRDELEGIADIVRRHKDLLVIVDEAYEWLTLPGHEHVRLATLDSMWDRCITIGSQLLLHS